MRFNFELKQGLRGGKTLQITLHVNDYPFFKYPNAPAIESYVKASNGHLFTICGYSNLTVTIETKITGNNSPFKYEPNYNDVINFLEKIESFSNPTEDEVKYWKQRACWC